MLSMEDLKTKQKNMDGILAILLSSLWQIFYDTPARREDFIHLTGSDFLPFWVCQHRWVENVEVAKQALKIWPHVNK